MSVMEVTPKAKFADLAFDEKLDRLAEVAVKVGLGLRAGQELIMSAPIEALPLVRRIIARMRSIVSFSIRFSCFCSSSWAEACWAMESSASMKAMRSS